MNVVDCNRSFVNMKRFCHPILTRILNFPPFTQRNIPEFFPRSYSRQHFIGPKYTLHHTSYGTKNIVQLKRKSILVAIYHHVVSSHARTDTLKVLQSSRTLSSTNHRYSSSELLSFFLSKFCGFVSVLAESISSGASKGPSSSSSPSSSPPLNQLQLITRRCFRTKAAQRNYKIIVSHLKSFDSLHDEEEEEALPLLRSPAPPPFPSSPMVGAWRM